MALRKPKVKKEKTNKSENKPEKEKKPGSANLLLMFVMMLAVFLVGAGMVIGYFKFLDPDPGNHEAKAEETKEVILSSMDLGDMVVNLADPGNHFLKTKVTVEYTKDKKTDELMSERKHQVIETVLLTLRKKTVAEVSPPEANERLKNEIIKAVNKQLGEEAVKKIYFTQYIVQ